MNNFGRYIKTQPAMRADHNFSSENETDPISVSNTLAESNNNVFSCQKLM